MHACRDRSLGQSPSVVTATVEPAVQCLSEEALRSQATTQTSFWFSVHLAEAVLYVWTFLHDVPSKYFPELLEDKAELAAFFALSACQCALYLRFHELGPLSDLPFQRTWICPWSSEVVSATVAGPAQPWRSLLGGLR